MPVGREKRAVREEGVSLAPEGPPGRPVPEVGQSRQHVLHLEHRESVILGLGRFSSRKVERRDQTIKVIRETSKKIKTMRKKNKTKMSF